jgi:L-ribulose-5-phosphate 4-epimerase
MLEKLKNSVFKANIDLVSKGLVIHTWGNVSGIDRKEGLIVIKPSGVSYETMIPADLVVLDLEGNIVEGHYKPSTDAPTHLLLYQKFNSIGGIVHTHSVYATAWAQAGRSIPPLGTTHADHFFGEIPCTRALNRGETETNYEINTGKLIVEKMENTDPLDMPAVLVNGHGPFCWGADAEKAVYNAITLEEVAKMALFTIQLGKPEPIDQFLIDKHFKRKHGSGSYYGQDK